jgi:hypothetical protein
MAFLARIGRVSAKATFASLLGCLLFALLSLVAANRDPSAARDQLKPLVADGTLFESMRLPIGKRSVPAWEGNDCLVFIMLALPRKNIWREAFSPRVTVRQLPKTEELTKVLAQARCLLLAELLVPGAAPEPLSHYDRYMHGQRVVGALLMPWIGPRGLRASVTVALVTALSSLALFAGAQAWRLRATSQWRRPAAFAWIAIGLLFLQGLPMYSHYWTHALSDLVPAVFLWVLYFRPPHGDGCDAGSAGILGAFGCCVALFEFLTGGLPLAAGLLLLIAAAQTTRPTMIGVFASLAAFGTGVLIPMMIKILAGSLVFDDFMMGAAGDQLLHRMFGSVVGEMAPSEVAAVAAWGFDVRLLDDIPLLRFPYAAFRIAYFSFVPGAGSTLLGMLVLGSAVLAVPILAWHAARRDNDAALRAAVIVGACGIVLVWYLLFLSHTLLHASWMVRCTVIFPLALGLLVLHRIPEEASIRVIGST